MPGNSNRLHYRIFFDETCNNLIKSKEIEGKLKLLGHELSENLSNNTTFIITYRAAQEDLKSEKSLQSPNTEIDKNLNKIIHENKEFAKNNGIKTIYYDKFMKWLHNEEKKLRSEAVSDGNDFEIRIKDDTNHFNSSLIKKYSKSKYPNCIEDCPIGLSPFIQRSYWKDYHINNNNSSNEEEEAEEEENNDEETTDNNNNNNNNNSRIKSEEDSIKLKLNQSESIKEISPLLKSNFNKKFNNNNNNKRPRGSGYCENCLEYYTDLYIHMENPRHKNIIESTGYYKDINIIFDKLLKLNNSNDNNRIKGKYVEVNGTKEWIWNNPNKYYIEEEEEEEKNENDNKEEENENNVKDNTNNTYDINRIMKLEMLMRRYYLSHFKYNIKVFNREINCYLYYHKLTKKLSIDKPVYYGKIMNKYEATKIILKLYYNWRGKKYKLDLLQIVHINKIIKNVKSFSDRINNKTYIKSIPIFIYEYIMFYELFINKNKEKCESILSVLLQNELISSNIYVIRGLLILLSDNCEVIKLRMNEVDTYFKKSKSYNPNLNNDFNDIKSLLFFTYLHNPKDNYILLLLALIYTNIYKDYDTAEHYYLIGIDNSNKYYKQLLKNYEIFLERRTVNGIYQSKNRGKVVIYKSEEIKREFEWILYKYKNENYWFNYITKETPFVRINNEEELWKERMKRCSYFGSTYDGIYLLYQDNVTGTLFSYNTVTNKYEIYKNENNFFYKHQ